VGNEEKAREKSNLKSNRPISFLLGGKPEGKENKPKNKDSRTYMDEKIDKMITENIQATEIEIKGKSKIGKKPNAL
jgi:hypothetical protein